jgi:hypothetical protein
LTWFVCTISKTSPKNWDLCKVTGLYGVPGGSRLSRPSATEGDHLLIWQGGAGYIAQAVVTGLPRVPMSRAEAPWPGGTYRFRWVVPIKVDLELNSPLKLGFQGDRQRVTGFSKTMFLRSFTRVDDRAAVQVSEVLYASGAGDTEALARLLQAAEPQNPA